MNKLGTVLWNLIERVMKFFCFRILRLKCTDKTWNKIMQFIRFGIVGLSNTLLGYLIYIVCLKFISSIGIWKRYDYMIAQLIMFLLTVLWSFYWNNRIVFKQEDGEKRNILLALLKTYISYAFSSLLLAEVLLYLWIDLLGINVYIAPLINLLITVPLNFLMQKFWTFKSNS